MARHYVIQDWSNSATWSGEMIGDRLSKSKGHHFLKNGMANTEMYAGDEEEDNKRKSRVSLKQRILPQASRVEKLTAEIIELEQAFKAGEYTPEEYSLLRSVAFKKRDRAVELYKRAVKPVAKTEDEYEESQPHTSSSKAPQHTHFPEQIATFSSNKARHSAKADLVYFLGAALSLLVLVKLFF